LDGAAFGLDFPLLLLLFLLFIEAFGEFLLVELDGLAFFAEVERFDVGGVGQRHQVVRQRLFRSLF
jgi:hypothetical protein